jgi:ribosomal protein S18 acetylase RimI-like enzyme
VGGIIARMPEPFAITRVDPREDARVAPALRAYLTEVQQACGINGAALDAAVADVADYVAPTGAFLVASTAGGDGPVLGCAAVRTLQPGIGELKRMWVDPSQRGRGLGGQLLRAIEDEARRLGLGTVRLDTNASLQAALALYRRSGYRPIDRYNANVDATHFLAKDLTATPAGRGR